MYAIRSYYVEALEDIGDKLGKAQSSYETAHNRLTDGRGNLVSRAEALKKLGLETSKRIPKELLDSGEGDEDRPEQLPDAREK